MSFRIGGPAPAGSFYYSICLPTSFPYFLSGLFMAKSDQVQAFHKAVSKSLSVLATQTPGLRTRRRRIDGDGRPRGHGRFGRGTGVRRCRERDGNRAKHENGKLHTDPDGAAGKSCYGADLVIKASIMPSFAIKKLYRSSPVLHQILHFCSAI